MVSRVGRKKGEKSMSGAGGVGGVGGDGGAHVGGTPGAGSGNTQKVTPAKGASGVSDDGDKNSLAIGDQNMIGNTQTQTANNHTTNNYYGMDKQEIGSMGSSDKAGGVQGMANAGEMDMQALMKLMMMMMIMKLLESIMNNSDGGGGGGAGGGGGQQGGFSGVM
jgi:hypothetical protein